MKTPKSDRGSILITTLWIMAILSLLAIGIGFRASLEIRLSKFSMDRLKARYVAKAGIVKSLGYMEDDENKIDTLYECGISFEKKEEDVLKAMFGEESNKLKRGAFSVHYEVEVESGDEGEITTKRMYGLVDEERKLNINIRKLTQNESITKETRKDFVTMLDRLLPDPEGEIEKGAMINALVDWQDPDDLPLQDGAEKTYYESLEFPYQCKNKDLEIPEELLLIKGMTREYFGKIRDHITVYGIGKINVNTAPKEVLMAVLGYEQLATAATEERNGTDKEEGTKDDRYWQTVGAFTGFLKSKFENMKKTIDAKSKYFTVTSDNFRIMSHGKVDKVEVLITCVIKKVSEEEKKKEKRKQQQQKTEEQAYEYYREI